MSARRHDLYLLTPGPLTVAPEVKAAMLEDRSPNAVLHSRMTQDIQHYVLDICNGKAAHVCVMLQGSATYGIEAGLQTLVPEGAKILVIENGFYGRRLREIAEGIGLSVAALELPMLPLPTSADIDMALDADPAITHILFCHVETGTGVVNPIAEIAEVARRRGVKLMIDSVAAFGAFPLDVEALDADAVFISPNKCLESVPGIAMVVVKTTSLEASAGRSRSLVLDLYRQWHFMAQTGAWRWTPPTHVVAALHKACERHKAEGCEGRLQRYSANWRRLVDTLRQRGLQTLLPDEVAAPIIATFYDPDHSAYSFPAFYAAMEKRGLIIFPGRLTAAGTFRIGVMGDLNMDDMTYILSSIDEALTEIGVGIAGHAA